jgi:hypothetical protein
VFVCLDYVAVLCGSRETRPESLPLFREEGGYAAAKQPVALRLASGRYAKEDELADAGGKLLGVSQGESTAPGAAENEPPVDREVFAESFDVSDQILGGVGGEVDLGCAGMRCAPAAVALVEEYDAVDGGIEKATVPRGTSGAGAAVQYESGLAVRVAALLPVHEVAVAGLEHTVLVGLDRRVECTHGGPLLQKSSS